MQARRRARPLCSATCSTNSGEVIWCWPTGTTPGIISALALLVTSKIEFVTALHQFRDADSQPVGKRLGKGDHVVAWAKPARPQWLAQEIYDRLPEQLEVREIHVNLDIPGFRTESLVVVTAVPCVINEAHPRQWSRKSLSPLLMARRN